MTRSLPALVLILAGMSWAQTPAAPPKDAQQPSAKSPDRPEISDTEKVRRSGESVSRMKDVLKDSLKKLQEARASNDVVKLNCVNEKLTQIKGLLRISEQADVALQESVARREAAAADHEFNKVTIAAQKVDQLRTEAESCIGQLAFRTDDEQQVQVSEPAYVPQADTALPVTVEPVISRAPASSPTL
ncbi:MAG: hypothetical protein RL653_1513 [Pseudomonadota bacterium]|jgi:hypothetical protein